MTARGAEDELLRFAVTGDAETWARLQDDLIGLIGAVADRVRAWSDSDAKTRGTEDVVKDIGRLAAGWAQAKVQKPSLENHRIQAQIASEFALAKERLASARKLDAEAKHVEMQTMTLLLDRLESLMRFAQLAGQLVMGRSGDDAHLMIGVDPRKLGEPAGDSASSR